MPRRAKPELSPERREAMIRDLLMWAERERQAQLDKYNYVYMAVEAGMTTREIAEVYDVTSDTVSRWRRAGERERERRRSGDPDRPREPEPNR